ncbi:unnamed protein product [Adineta ricciae]|uniref:Uncharacterized protein n=1 Tax=Adineta ricciae TaxID=249248 RepID=A0A814WHT4_ADIRI|nr:unnamed protein product [Adineta ricciae]CAF1202442.1 unnamed protein product [Adineta ricciae]
MDTRIVNALERKYGIDLNGDGFIGGEGYLSQLERATGRDFNGDGVLGRRPDVVPGYPAASGYPSMVYGPTGQVYATNGFVAPNHSFNHPHSHHHHHMHRHF